jgi:hypothetical protein
MSAQPNASYNAGQPSLQPPCRDARAEAVDERIDEMMADVRVVADFTSDRYDRTMDALLSILLSKGLPRCDKSMPDDMLHERITACIDSLRDDFRSWATPRAEREMREADYAARDE